MVRLQGPCFTVPSLSTVLHQNSFHLLVALYKYHASPLQVCAVETPASESRPFKRSFVLYRVPLVFVTPSFGWTSVLFPPTTGNAWSGNPTRKAQVSILGFPCGFFFFFLCICLRLNKILCVYVWEWERWEGVEWEQEHYREAASEGVWVGTVSESEGEVASEIVTDLCDCDYQWT
jgi:hypothetical protein